MKRYEIYCPRCVVDLGRRRILRQEGSDFECKNCNLSFVLSYDQDDKIIDLIINNDTLLEKVICPFCGPKSSTYVLSNSKFKCNNVKCNREYNVFGA